MRLYYPLDKILVEYGNVFPFVFTQALESPGQVLVVHGVSDRMDLPKWFIGHSHPLYRRVHYKKAGKNINNDL